MKTSIISLVAAAIAFFIVINGATQADHRLNHIKRTPTPVATATSTPTPGRISLSNPNGDCIAHFGLNGTPENPIVIENYNIGPCGGHGIMLYRSSYVIIRNLSVFSTGNVNTQGAGILALESHHITIDNVWSFDTARQLVMFNKSSDSVARNVNLGLADAWPNKLGWDGLSAYQSHRITIENSQIRGGEHDNGCGVIIDDYGTDNIIRNNLVENFVNGSFCITDGERTLMEGNTANNCRLRSTGAASCMHVWDFYSGNGLPCRDNRVRFNNMNSSNPLFAPGSCTNTLFEGNSWQ